MCGVSFGGEEEGLQVLFWVFSGKKGTRVRGKGVLV